LIQTSTSRPTRAAHLLQLWNDDKSATDLIDFALMNEQVAFFTDLTGRYLSAPSF